MDEILSDEIVGVSYDKRSYYKSSPTIWIGSWDGLARAMDSDGTNWKIYRANFDPDEVYCTPVPLKKAKLKKKQESVIQNLTFKRKEMCEKLNLMQLKLKELEINERLWRAAAPREVHPEVHRRG